LLKRVDSLEKNSRTNGVYFDRSGRVIRVE